jgi:hypothetical protein
MQMYHNFLVSIVKNYESDKSNIRLLWSLMKNKIIKMCPEDELIFCCARNQIDSETKDKINSLLQKDLNWVKMIASAYEQNVTKLFYFQLNSICPEEVPKKYLDVLRSYFRKYAQANLILTVKLLEVLELFGSNDIITVTYKGPALAQLAYGNILLVFDHLDVFICEDDVQRVKELLLSQGYKLDLQLYPRNEQFFPRSQPELTFIHEDTGIIIKIRWKFVKTSFSSSHDLESFWNPDRLKPIYINGFKVMTPPAEDYFSFYPSGLLRIIGNF